MKKIHGQIKGNSNKSILSTDTTMVSGGLNSSFVEKMLDRKMDNEDVRKALEKKANK